MRPALPSAAAVLLAACSLQLGVPPASPSVAPSASPTASPSPALSPAPSASASVPPEPSPTPDDGVMDLAVTGCHGGIVVEWSAVDDPRFHHYSALRSDAVEIDPAYPPIAPAVDWGDSYATDPFVTSAVDATLIPTDTLWHYRVMAYDALDRVIAASVVRAARLKPVVELGPLVVTAGPERPETHLDWRLYGGLSKCFSWYKILYSHTDATPSDLEGSPVLSVIADQSTTELLTDALTPGDTYFLRVQAIRASSLGSFVVAETDAATYTVPAP
ncbi:MAG: hypothetical protein ACRDGV_06905 [Candidatus Limnocylindria bacterium]